MNAPLHREIPAGLLDADQALTQITAQWDGDIVKQLTDYIAIPAKSPSFDADWAQHGFIDTVMRNAATWVEAQKIEGLTLEVVRLEGRTPVLFFEIPASSGGAGASPLHQPVIPWATAVAIFEFCEFCTPEARRCNSRPGAEAQSAKKYCGEVQG